MIGIFCLCGSTAMITVLYNYCFIYSSCATVRCPSNSMRWPVLDCIPKTFCRSGPSVARKL